MTEIDVPDWVVEAALKAWFSGEDYENADMSAFNEDMRATLTAALGAWVVPVGFVDLRNLARLAENKAATAWPAMYANADDVTLYTLRQEKPE